MNAHVQYAPHAWHASACRWPAIRTTALLAGALVLGARGGLAAEAPVPASRCAALASMEPALATGGQRIPNAIAQPAGSVAPTGFGDLKGPPLPAHCEIIGILHERAGQDGDRYAIRYHLRLPGSWNGHFLFQGGGGTDGVMGDALGLGGHERALTRPGPLPRTWRPDHRLSRRFRSGLFDHRYDRVVARRRPALPRPCRGDRKPVRRAGHADAFVCGARGLAR